MAWRDLRHDAHGKAFTAAAVPDPRRVAGFHQAVSEAISKGWSLAGFRRRVAALLKGAV